MADYRIVYEAQALNSLDEIAWYYTTTAGYAVADNNLQKIFTSINSLDTMPMRCPVADFSPHIHKFVIIGLPYIAFFTLRGDCVHILDVFHTRQSQDIWYTRYQQQN